MLSVIDGKPPGAVGRVPGDSSEGSRLTESMKSEGVQAGSYQGQAFHWRSIG